MPATTRGIWWIVAFVAIIFVAVMSLLLVSARGSTGSRFDISSEGLRIHGDLYGQLIHTASLKGGAAQIIDLNVDTAFAPKRRTMGTAVSGYRSGWFRLRNGREALVYLTDRNRAVHVPTKAGFDLLISPQNPERFVERLREIAPGL